MIEPVTALPNKPLSSPAAEICQSAKTRLKAACTSFEAAFVEALLHPLLKEMSGGDSMGKGGYQSKVFQGMIEQQMAKELSKNDSFGLAKCLYKSLEPRLSSQSKAESATSELQQSISTEPESVLPKIGV